MAIFYGINEVGLNVITLDPTITIKDNNSGFLQGENNNVVVADKNGYNVFDKTQNQDGVNYVIIYSNNEYHLYTWQNAKNSTSLWLITKIQAEQSNLLKDTWEPLNRNVVNTIIGVCNNPKGWDKIGYGDASTVCLSFAKSALQYGSTAKTFINLVNNNRLGFGIKAADEGDKVFEVNGTKYATNVGNGSIPGFMNMLTNSFTDEFYLEVCYDVSFDDIYYALYKNPKLDMEIYADQLIKNHNIILNGAPGTGKTHLAHEIAAKMLGKSTWAEVEKNQNLSSHVGFVQFHPSYDYTDFVEGLRPTTQGNTPFELLPGIFKKFCEEALKKGYKNNGNGEYETSDEGEVVAVDNAKPYIFIIDEINRGEMSKIFGELFFSIDPGYRGRKGKVQTQYANMEKNGNEFDKALANDKYGQFFVPENVYIIGTMNDIDRSVESMDFAMRRRFKFVEILASKQDGMLKKKFGNDADIVICKMNNLNLAIQKTEGLGSEYHIGPSYFLKLDENMDFYELWEEYLKGIIYEYLRGRDDVSETLARIQEAYNEA